MRPTMTADTPVTINVTLDCPPHGEQGHDVLDFRTETLWLPIIGPTAMVLARCLVAGNGGRGGIYVTAYLAHDLGVGVPRLWAAFKRLERAKLATIEHDTTPHVAVRILWPTPRPKAVTS